jgi:hypothetical protein
MTQWDGNWYRLIAQNGYAPPMPPVAAAFFPLYPLGVRAVALVVRDLQVASLLVSNGCLIAASLLLVRLLRCDYDELVCRRAITFLMFNPVSFFFPRPTANRHSFCSPSEPYLPRDKTSGCSRRSVAVVYPRPVRLA